MYYRDGKLPCTGILLNYDDDDYSQGSGQIKEAFRILTKDDMLQTYILQDNFRSSKIRVDDVGYKLYVFDIQCQQNFLTSQPNEVEFNVDGIGSKDLNGYSLVLTNR